MKRALYLPWALVTWSAPGAFLVQVQDVCPRVKKRRLGRHPGCLADLHNFGGQDLLKLYRCGFLLKSCCSFRGGIAIPNLLKLYLCGFFTAARLPGRPAAWLQAGLRDRAPETEEASNPRCWIKQIC